VDILNHANTVILLKNLKKLKKKGNKMSKVKEFIDLEVDGVDSNDYPDFVVAFISSATAVLEDGTVRDATDEELEGLTNDGVAQQMAYENFF
jgi:hypothetical protein